MTLITRSEDLAAFCKTLEGVDYVTVDTEFIRERTYWPVLCLVQIGGPDDAVAIDALADGMDLQPVIDLLANPKILKVFHAARQDMEIFCHMMGEVPGPIFDTQVAATVCGFGDSVGYETLVSKLARASIDKSSRFTDWSLRPLSEKQVNYAISDVTHLRTVYEKLVAKIEANGRGEWVAAEMAGLAEMSVYITDPRKAYERIKIRKPTPRVLAVLRELAAWREEEARRVDVPKNRILRDESLVEIAHHPAKDARQLGRIRGLSQKMAEGNQGRRILDAIARGLAVPDGECPKPVDKDPLPRGIGPISDILKVLLKMCSEESGVAQRLIASAAEVDEIAAYGTEAKVPALSGWRRELFGEAALRLRAGKTALAVDGKKLVCVDRDDDRP